MAEESSALLGMENTSLIVADSDEHNETDELESELSNQLTAKFQNQVNQGSKLALEKLHTIAVKMAALQRTLSAVEPALRAKTVSWQTDLIAKMRGVENLMGKVVCTGVIPKMRQMNYTVEDIQERLDDLRKCFHASAAVASQYSTVKKDFIAAYDMLRYLRKVFGEKCAEKESAGSMKNAVAAELAQ